MIGDIESGKKNLKYKYISMQDSDTGQTTVTGGDSETSRCLHDTHGMTNEGSTRNLPKPHPDQHPHKSAPPEGTMCRRNSACS